MSRLDSFLGAERKGFDAYVLDDRRCPYRDTRKASGRLTWSRAYRNAWIMGYIRAANYCGDTKENNYETWSVDYE